MKFTALLTTLSLTGLSLSLSLPPPSGPYSVGTVDFPLTDNSRKDAFAPNSTRKIMITVYYPSKQKNHNSTTPYLPVSLASAMERDYQLPEGIFSIITSNSIPSATPYIPKNGLDVILFSHGLGGSRLVSATVLEDLASHGYAVVSIDHTYDSLAVEFPDGTVIPTAWERNNTNANGSVALIEKFYDQRVKDTTFVVSMLEDLPVIGSRKYDKGKKKPVGMFGHSLGGATTAGAMVATNRIIGGINMDGSHWGESITGNLSPRPFVLMTAENHTSVSGNDPSWVDFRKAQTGWNAELAMNGSGHLTYSDFPVLVDMLGLKDKLGDRLKEVEGYVGTINGTRALAIQRAYLKAFWDWVLRGKGKTLYEGPKAGKKFPEIKWIQ